MDKLKHLLVCLAVLCWANDKSVAETPRAELDPALEKLSQMIGGAWTNDNPKFRVEFRYEWVFNRTAVRGRGIIDKGGLHEKQVESTFAWDPARKAVYYLDFHGGNEVYQGTVRLEGDQLYFNFETLVGSPGKYRSTAKLPDKDTYEFTILGEKDGKWVPVVKQALKRRQEPLDEGKLTTEAVIDAPLDQVWDALTTKEGLESWNVAHADVDLRVGGLMRTHYDPKGQIGDPHTIENKILCLDSKHMYAIQVTNPPAGFPYKEAIKNVWTVLYLDEVAPSRTRVRVVGNGYGSNEESQKLRAFFDRGNSFTLKKLQDKFAGKKSKAAG